MVVCDRDLGSKLFEQIECGDNGSRKLVNSEQPVVEAEGAS